jgi:hypothetical protein
LLDFALLAHTERQALGRGPAIPAASGAPVLAGNEQSKVS